MESYELDESDKLSLPEYFFIFISGIYGGGKTLLEVMLAEQLSKTYNYIYANLNILKIPNFIKYDKLNDGILLNLEPDSVCIADELYKSANSRKYQDTRQINLTDSLQEIRKTKVIFIGSASDSFLIDNRVRNIFNIHIRALGSYKSIGFPNIFKYKFVQDRHILPNLIEYPEQEFYIDMSKWFSYYDTYQKINRKPILNPFMPKD